MRAWIYGPLYYTAWAYEATPVCGSDFCAWCWECLSCYGNDPCKVYETHKWEVYDNEFQQWIEDHPDWEKVDA